MISKLKGASLAADFSLFFVAIIWGSGFIAMRFAIDSDMSVSLIMATRFSIAAFLLGIVFFKSIRTLNRNEFLIGLPAGLLLFTAFYAQTVGLKYTTPSNNAFITATNVIMVPFISWVLLKKAPKLKSFILATVTLIGIAFLTWSPKNGIVFNVGDLFTFLCALLFAGHIAYLDIASKKVPAGKLTFIQMAVAALLSVLSLVFFDIDSVSSADFSKGLLPVVYLGIFSTSICFLIQTAAQRKTTSTKAAIFLSTESLFGSSFSVILKIEPFTFSMLLGGAIIMTAIVLSEVEWRPKRKSGAR